eukprot:scaffold225_cov111-Isochrysis_galbana.AAC.8
MRPVPAGRWLTTRTWQRFSVWRVGGKKGKPGAEGDAPKEIPDSAFLPSQADMAGSIASPPVAEGSTIAGESVGGWLATRRDLEARGLVAAISGGWEWTAAW